MLPTEGTTRPMTNQLLRAYPDAAMALGGISRRKVFAMIAAREIASVKVGAGRFISTAAIQQYIDTHQVPAADLTDDEESA